MQGNKGQSILARLSSVRVPDSLIDDAIELAVESIPQGGDRDELATRLEDDTHRRVLRKEVVDVVILTTGAMEAPTVDAYHELIDALEPSPFDATTGQVKTALMRRMAAIALEELEGDERDVVIALLREGLTACGDYAAFEDSVVACAA